MIIGILLGILSLTCEGKIYDKCEFARTMKANGVTRDLGTWTCIAKHESNFDTHAINHQTGDYGILQISHLYWCSPPGTGCGITCQSLLSDDIREDIVCARKVFDETTRIRGNGFTAWTTYQYCQGDQSGWISGCGV